MTDWGSVRVVDFVLVRIFAVDAIGSDLVRRGVDKDWHTV